MALYWDITALGAGHLQFWIRYIINVLNAPIEILYNLNILWLPIYIIESQYCTRNERSLIPLSSAENV